MGGTSSKTQPSNAVDSQAALTVSQLIRFNSVVRRCKDSKANYHTKEREMPLAIYVGILLHAETRKRGLVDKLRDLGLSVSYNRALENSSELGNKIECTISSRERRLSSRPKTEPVYYKCSR